VKDADPAWVKLFEGCIDYVSNSIVPAILNSNGMEDEIINAVLDKLFEIKNKLVLKDIFTRVLRQEIFMKKRDLEESDFESNST